MTPDSIDNFLSLYLRSLYEESREVKAGPRYGFDRVIHQIAIADGSTPVRLPFFRGARDKLPKPKKEAEHGVDMSFISPDREILTVFVLKDEALTYKNFIGEGMDKDLRMAAMPDLKDPALADIKRVRVVLGYNKDEDEEGVEQFELLAGSHQTRLKRGIRLEFDRWNLTKITELAKERLLSPSLLPDSFYNKFSYICAQYGDFDATSPHWSELLIPDWREFLDDVLQGPTKETKLRLVSIALIILSQHAKTDAKGRKTSGAALGWIEIVEWAMLALWKASAAAPKKTSRKIKRIVVELWFTFYLEELQAFYREHAQSLTSTHSLEIPGEELEDAGGSYRAHWHLGRLGLLSMALSEIIQSHDETSRQVGLAMLHEVQEWTVGLLNSNPSCFRPMLDIQHIEQFLVWRSLAVLNRWEDLEAWLHELTERIYVRYMGLCGITGIDYRNSWELLMDDLSGTDPRQSIPTASSYLLLMLMELCLSLPEGRGDAIVKSIHSRFVVEHEDESKRPKNAAGPVDLISWSPPEDWGDRILAGQDDGGYGITVALDHDNPASSLRNFVTKSLEVEAGKTFPACLPSVLILGCLRHSIPVPPAMWRHLRFAHQGEGEAAN